MKKSKWKDFAKDVGDIMSGILVGAALSDFNISLLIIGVLFIGLSLYLEHFKNTANE